MHNIKDIRNNFDNFKNIIKSRNISIDLDQILDLDQKNRKLIQVKETLEQEKKIYLAIEFSRMTLCWRLLVQNLNL